jgi:hypothetical protein
MKVFRIFAIAAMAMLAGASAQAGVVLSNLGSSGLSTAGVSTSSTEQTASVRNGAGFLIGANAFTLDSVGLLLEGLPNPNEISTSIAIYTDNSGNPSTTLVGTSVAQNVDVQKVYQFSFTSGGLALNASQKYWAVIQTGVGVKWFGMTSLADPTPQNGSLLTFDRFRQSGNFDTTPTWGNTGVNAYGFSVFGTEAGGAVPEPALTSLLCFGGIALIRRRMKK